MWQFHRIFIAKKNWTWVHRLFLYIFKIAKSNALHSRCIKTRVAVITSMFELIKWYKLNLINQSGQLNWRKFMKLLSIHMDSRNMSTIYFSHAHYFISAVFISFFLPVFRMSISFPPYTLRMSGHRNWVHLHSNCRS